jgi:hypothetical protein
MHILSSGCKPATSLFCAENRIQAYYVKSTAAEPNGPLSEIPVAYIRCAKPAKNDPAAAICSSPAPAIDRAEVSRISGRVLSEARRTLDLNSPPATADFLSNKSIVLDLHDRVQTFAALIGDLAAARLAPGRTLLFNSHHPFIAARAQRTVFHTLVQFHCAILNRQCGTGVAIRWRGKENED